MGGIARPLQAFNNRTPSPARRMPMTDRKDEIAALNTLIATAIDSVTGFEDGAANIENSRLQELFRDRARERSRIVEELRSEVRRLGGEPEGDGRLAGASLTRSA